MNRRAAERRTEPERRQDPRRERVRAANAVIAALASTGPRLLWSPIQEKVSLFGLDRHAQIWLIDGHTGMKLPPFGTGYWDGFTGGAAMQILLAALSEYIDDGTPVATDFITPELWGYSADDAATVRNQVFQTGAVQAPPNFIPFKD